MYVLALEASTQAAKAAVVGLDGHIVAQANLPYPDGVSDIVSMDVQGVFTTLLRAGQQVVAQAKAQGTTSIGAVGLCTIWQSLLPLNRKGEPMGRATTWAHTGAGDTAAAIRNDPALCRAYYQRTGCIPHSQLPVFQARHLFKAEPELLHNGYEWGSLSSFLLAKLTGKGYSSRCTISGSGWMNLSGFGFDDMALELSGLSLKSMPELCDADQPLSLLPEIQKILGVGDIPLAAGGGDGALNQIGSGALKEGVMTCSIGTSGAIRIASKQPILTDPPATWCYYAAQGWRVSGAATSGACNCVDWVRHHVMADRPFGELEASMQKAQSKWSNAPIFLPFLWGERCPGWQDTRTGGFVGLCGMHGEGEMYYAALEGVLLLLRLCFDRMTPISGIPELLTISGGIAHSKPWLQMAADIFERPIEISSVENASLMGAAALAMVVGGQLQDLAKYPAPKGTMIQPDTSLGEHYSARMKRFEEAYHACYNGEH